MTNKRKKAVSDFKFKKFDRIGAVDALEDKDFLQECFIDNSGELDILRDTNSPECLILGRTGSGKTALLERLSEVEDRVIKISPESLALSYLSNNQALKTYMEMGVDLDLFFRVLWRHIFAIEILRAHFDIYNPQRENSFFAHLRNLVLRKQSQKIARDYLLERREFWKETDYRIKEYTKKLETELKAATSAKLSAVLGVASGEVQITPDLNRKLTKEQKVEIVQIGQNVVNKQQMRELSEVINLLSDELVANRQKRYFLTIDRLDERWVHDPLRYRLIRALIETIRDINNRLETVKVAIAIREDLLERVFRATRESGDQLEKYRSLYIELSWNRKSLEKVLTCRVNQLIRHSYAKSIQVRLADIFPKKIDKNSTAVTYMINRTLLMPRDIIIFFNECIQEAEGKAVISKTNILAAEGIYSTTRLTALADEWSADYPNLVEALNILKKSNSVFTLRDIDRKEFDDYMVDFLIKCAKTRDYLYNLFDEKLGDFDDVMPDLMRIFFKVGIVGVKNESFLETYWSFERKRIRKVEIDKDTKLYIHPAFWRVLGVKEKK